MKKTTMLRFFTYWKLNSAWLGSFTSFQFKFIGQISKRKVKQIFRNDFLNHFVRKTDILKKPTKTFIGHTAVRNSKFCAGQIIRLTLRK